MVQQHDKDLYRGNGKPGITTRIELCEERQEQMKETMDSMRGTMRAVFVMAATTMLGVIGEIIARLVVR